MTQYFKTVDLMLDVKEKKEQTTLFQKLIGGIFTKRKKRPSTVAMENIRKMYKNLKDSKASSIDGFRINDDSFNFELLLPTTSHQSTNRQLNLMRDFEQLVKLLSAFVEEPKEETYEIEISIERPKPKKVSKVTTYEKITILERWVKIGYKMYRRHFNVWTGESYIVVDGDVYDIKCDRYGREYLA